MKKVVSLLLVAVMALGMTVTAFAATPKITGQVKSLGVSGGSAVLDLDTINPQDEVEIDIPLSLDMFEGKDGLPTSGPVTQKLWRDSKMNVRMSVSSGSKAIDSYEFKSKDSKIVVSFVDEFVSTSDLDFDFRIYLIIDGKRQTDYELQVTGTIENDITEVYADDDYVDLSNGVVAEAQEFVKKVEADLGNGVSIHTKFFKDKKYYGTATRDVEESDDSIMAKYSDIDSVLTLKTIGLNGSGNIVALGDEYADHYVYDKDLNYLGTAKEMLPYSTKYYLSTKKLDIVADEEPDDDGEELPPETENPGTGGDEAPANVNDNPGTGR